jgi:hypothetical protein
MALQEPSTGIQGVGYTKGKSAHPHCFCATSRRATPVAVLPASWTHGQVGVCEGKRDVLAGGTGGRRAGARVRTWRDAAIAWQAWLRSVMTWLGTA